MTASTHFTQHRSTAPFALALMFVAALLPIHAARAADAKATHCAALAQQMLAALVRGDNHGAARAFDADMRSALPPQKLSELWAQVKSNYGDYKTSRDARTLRVNGVDVVITPLRFARTALDAQVACNDKGQIAGFYLRPEQLQTQAAAQHL
jgi:hypothetical protein